MIKTHNLGKTLIPGDLPWWKGSHGEWYLAAQLALMALVFFGPRTLPSLPGWPTALAQILRIVGVVLIVAGSGLLLAGLLQLGSRSLSPLPSPRRHAALIQTGPYRLVRHPMYAGGMVLAYGWGLAVHGWLTLVYATVLAVFLDIKSSREERWLVEKFPDYLDYQRRVSKLIPFIH
jgi:protein-S-isoprenylcysteine O-methyltransferase Ste14